MKKFFIKFIGILEFIATWTFKLVKEISLFLWEVLTNGVAQFCAGLLLLEVNAFYGLICMGTGAFILMLNIYLEIKGFTRGFTDTQLRLAKMLAKMVEADSVFHKHYLDSLDAKWESIQNCSPKGVERRECLECGYESDDAFVKCPVCTYQNQDGRVL